MFTLQVVDYITFMCLQFSKYSFRWHSAYFHSALCPSFRRKKSASNFPQITPWQLSAFRIPQNTPCLWRFRSHRSAETSWRFLPSAKQNMLICESGSI